ncbi:RNA polymerase sigma factor [Actinomycetospora sp. CA-101289]|uniref:RNA polymerase sigma factor n=1 Tax=Actinomycetospora sp. CA-101289 TaxID=3239893 RepID=UPI003D96D76C
MESARIVAGVARVVRDVGRAEELAHDALVAAMEQWPREGVPDNPGAWLTATARRRAIDVVRREQTLARKTELLVGRAGDDAVAPAADVAVGDGAAAVGDDLLALLFATCHPAVARESRVALTLRLFGGLTTDEIAHAFLVPSPTIGQRISRAKKRLAGVGPDALAVPTGDELAARLGAVLEVVYLVFNEGYAATTGVDWTRPALCVEAMRLGRVLAALQPGEPEVHGLVALMELQASRLRARVGPSGEPVLLGDQDRARWDRVLLQRGLAALARAEAGSEGSRGRYTLQAAIAACHARARSTDDTDWAAIAALYAELAALTPSPVVELNRAVAVSRAEGPEAGLAVLEPLMTDPTLAGYHLLPAVRADMLTALGRIDEAVAELDRALALVRTVAERELLERRRLALSRS